MTDRVKSTLKIGWLLAAASFVILPVVVPSYPDARHIATAIESSTLGMFLLSFPSSLIATPMLYLNVIALGLYPGSLAGHYMVIVLLAVVGYLQWFWIVPKLFIDVPGLQRLDLRESVGNRRLFERAPETYDDWFDNAGTSPLEHVIRDDERPHSL